MVLFSKKEYLLLLYFLLAIVASNGSAAAQTAIHGHSNADLQHMAENLAARLAASPSDIDRWVLLGRTEAALQNWGAARDALARAIALNGNDAALHAQLGEILTLAAGGAVTTAARAEFARAPGDPRARFYTAMARAQSGDVQAALAQLQALTADAPSDATWRPMVQDEIAALTPPTPHPPDESATATQIKTYLDNLDQPRLSIANLAAELRAHPENAKAWIALSTAYQAKGDTAQALDTLRNGNLAAAGNLTLLLAYADMLSLGIHGNELPAELVETMRQVAALDADQPDALWYLGQDAANRGDPQVARKFWSRLLSGLPLNSAEHEAVQARLQQLK